MESFFQQGLLQTDWWTMRTITCGLGWSIMDIITCITATHSWITNCFPFSSHNSYSPLKKRVICDRQRGFELSNDGLFGCLVHLCVALTKSCVASTVSLDYWNICIWSSLWRCIRKGAVQYGSGFYLKLHIVTILIHCCILWPSNGFEMFSQVELTWQ